MKFMCVCVFFSIKYIAIAIFYLKFINFIYSVDKTFQLIKNMDFNSTGPRCDSCIFPYASSGQYNRAFSDEDSSEKREIKYKQMQKRLSSLGKKRTN